MLDDLVAGIMAGVAWMLIMFAWELILLAQVL
jgi:hypothetical protein